MWFSRPTVSPDMQDWLFEEFDFAISQQILRPDTPLVLPTKAFFKAPAGTGEDVAAAVIEDLKRLLNIADAEIHVLPLGTTPLEQRVVDYNQLGETSGTWQEGPEAGSGVIHYDPAHMHEPIPFIATMTHELMHHILLSNGHRTPDDMAEEELRTDLHCITAGGGVIQLSAADQMGWAGYMRQPTRGYALALFLRVRGFPDDHVKPMLSARCWKYVKKAYRDLDQRADAVAALKSRLTRA